MIRDDHAWRYLGLDLAPAVRRLRIWQIAPPCLVAVITQRPGDTGTSVAYGVDMVLAQLAVEHPRCLIELYLHYPADSFAPEQFDAMTTDDTGHRWWTHTSAEDLASRLGNTLLERP